MHRVRFAVLLVFIACAAGCSSTPPARQTGFLSDYSLLVRVDDRTARYISPRVKDYSTVIVDPMESRLRPGSLTDEERAEAMRYMRDTCERTFAKAGFTVVEDVGVGVARVQVALTDVAASTWWMKIHPGMRFSGAGTGGAAMEAEVIDSVTGEQLAAVVQASSGNQFNLTAFSTLADAKGAMDKWADIAARRLQEMKTDPVTPR